LALCLLPTSHGQVREDDKTLIAYEDGTPPHRAYDGWDTCSCRVAGRVSGTTCIHPLLVRFIAESRPLLSVRRCFRGQHRRLRGLTGRPRPAAGRYSIRGASACRPGADRSRGSPDLTRPGSTDSRQRRRALGRRQCRCAGIGPDAAARVLRAAPA
jgi:hypothetical protein